MLYYWLNTIYIFIGSKLFWKRVEVTDQSKEYAA